MRGKQSVKKGFWYIGAKKIQEKETKRNRIYVVLLAPAAAPILGKAAKLIIKKILVVEKEEEDERKISALSKSCPAGSKSA